MQSLAARHAIVPPYLLTRIAAAEPRFPTAAEVARRTLLMDSRARTHRAELRFTVDGGRLVAEATPAPERTVADARGTETLPGTTVRREDDPPVSDIAVNQAFDGLGATYALYWDAFRRDSIDGTGMPLDATVHYGHAYDNAFWNGERVVFGDGDGEVFQGFTGSLSVIGHEMSHGVIERTAALVYQGQSGALNESIADVFGALTEQHALGQTAAQASWLIGAGLFTTAVHGVALRSMKAPGTAYDDPELGRDPQPASMRDYVTTTEDNGGVHLNSGIPNHAFYLVATALGGPAWERAGSIWYDALTGGLSASADFAAFAAATVTAAVAAHGTGSEEAVAVSAAWRAVGVGLDV
ncbi:M4 family metallopeptidase [Microbacterium gorillae]|uniref:M4 family metallopeptidase n=1 Tax=Microbacterium gorillae TaxID=1231063 RepID=UPI00058F4D62|nr:M4 family metallopeptidase [Microbacterium gorillae]